MENYREIRKKLVHGDIKKIADELGLNQAYVSDVLRSQLTSKFAAANDLRKKALQKRIDQILKKSA